MDHINDEPTPHDATDPVDDASATDASTTDAVGEPDAVGETKATDDTRDHESFGPTPPIGAVPGQRQLTRDPYATFGGVLSGIAHRYGWDVSLTRLAFVVVTLLSAGFALLAYIAAWVIIPRATHWPPAQVAQSRNRLSSRDLGIGLIGLGAVVVVAAGSGGAGVILVPVAMVGAGVWLLFQSPREQQSAAPAMEDVGGSMSGPTDQPMAGSLLAPPAPTVVAQPVPKRSRLRRLVLVGLFGLLGLMLVAIIALPVGLVWLVVDGDTEFSSGEGAVYRPTTIEEIPTSIVADVGEIELDLRLVDFDSITSSDDPVEIDVDLDLGAIIVRLPEDLRVAIDADVDLGDVTVFGSNEDGINPSISVDQAAPQVDLDLNLNVGEVTVTRGGSLSLTVIESD